MALTAFGLHALLFALAAISRHWSVDQMLQMKDTWSYLLLAKAVAGKLSVHSLSAFDRRVFIGYPVLVALLVIFGFPVLWAGLFLSWIAAALSAPLAAKVTEDERMGWAMAVLFPSYLMYATLAMSEATLLWFTLWGLWQFKRRRPTSSGTLLGYAGLVRPMACFAVLGLLAEGIAERRWRHALQTAIIAAAVVFAGTVLRQLWAGDAFAHLGTYAHDQRAFNGRMLTWPFAALLETPRQQDVPLWKVLYVWAHVAVTLGACGLLLRERAWGLSIWLIGNTAFALSIGSSWGFHEFPRFILPALPALLYAYRKWYPTTRRGWAILATVAAAATFFGLVHAAGVAVNIPFPGGT